VAACVGRPWAAVFQPCLSQVGAVGSEIGMLDRYEGWKGDLKTGVGMATERGGKNEARGAAGGL
jgi:hypothetical protein